MSRILSREEVEEKVREIRDHNRNGNYCTCENDDQRYGCVDTFFLLHELDLANKKHDVLETINVTALKRIAELISDLNLKEQERHTLATRVADLEQTLYQHGPEVIAELRSENERLRGALFYIAGGAVLDHDHSLTCMDHPACQCAEEKMVAIACQALQPEEK